MTETEQGAGSAERYVPTDTQREPTAAELEAVGQGLLDEIELDVPVEAANRLLIAIAKRVRAVEAELSLTKIQLLNAFINGCLWEQAYASEQAARSSAARDVARRRAAQRMWPEGFRAWLATLPPVDEPENLPAPPTSVPPLYCPECDHPTAANGMCFQCHPIEGALPRYEAHPCEYRTARRHSPWCPWASRNSPTPAPTAQGESTGGEGDGD